MTSYPGYPGSSSPTLALVLDWGGVLTTPVTPSFQAWAESEGIPYGAFESVMGFLHNTDDSPLHEVEMGLISGADFESDLARRLREASSVPVEAEGLLQRLFTAVTDNDPMRALATSARARGWTVAILSNTWGFRYDEESLLRVADHLLLSEEMGLRKPMPSIYREAADRIGVEPSRCLFVDDLRRNVRGAREVGMSGLHYVPGIEERIQHLMDEMEKSTQ